MFKLFKKKSELEKLRESFQFLENEYDYTLMTKETKDYYKGKNLLI
jgi:hypothetical protein